MPLNVISQKTGISDQSIFSQFISAAVKFEEAVYRLMFVHCKTV